MNTKKIFSASHLLAFKDHVLAMDLKHLHKIAPHVFPKFSTNTKPTFLWKQNTNTALTDTLNKLSSSNFTSLVSKCIILCGENHMQECVQLIMKKVQLESHFASLYAHFCVAMKQHFTSFETLLQEALHKNYQALTGQHCNLMRFVGFLYVEQFVPLQQLEQVAVQLLQQDLIMPFCHLMESCGAVLDKQHPQLVQAWFTQVQQCASKHDAKTRFAILDLVELRTKLQWKVKFDKHLRVFVEQPQVAKSQHTKVQQKSIPQHHRTSIATGKKMQPKRHQVVQQVQKSSKQQPCKKVASNLFAALQDLEE